MPTLEELRKGLVKLAEEKASKPDPVDAFENPQNCEMCSDTQGVFNHRGHRIPCPTCLPPVIRFGADGACLTCDGAEEVRDPKHERWPCPTCQDPVPEGQVGEILEKAVRADDIRHLSDEKLMELAEKAIGKPFTVDIGQEMCVCGHWNIDHDIRPGKANKCDFCSCAVFEKAAKCASCNGSGLDPDNDSIRCTGPCRPSGGNGYICERKDVNAKVVDSLKILSEHDFFKILPKITGVSYSEEAKRILAKSAPTKGKFNFCRSHGCEVTPRPGRSLCDSHWQKERYCARCKGTGERRYPDAHSSYVDKCDACEGTGHLCSHCGAYAGCDFCRFV